MLVTTPAKVRIVHKPIKPSAIFHKVADSHQPILQERILDAMGQARAGVDRDALARAFEARDPGRVEVLLGLYNFRLVERRHIRGVILKIMQEKGDEAAARLLRMRNLKKFEIYKANEAAKQSGVMVALVPPAGVMEQLQRYASCDERDNLHMTLVYLGKLEDLTQAQIPWLSTIVRSVAHQQAPLEGLIQGVGRFNGSPSSDGKDVFWAHVDMPGLSEFRQKLVDELRRQGLPVKAEHGFTPHITLAYIDPSEPLPVDKIPSIPFSVDRVLIKVGDHKEVTAFSVLKGDIPGHEFHGNQWTGEGGTGGTEHGVPIPPVTHFDQLEAAMGMHDQDPKVMHPERYEDRSGGKGWLSLKPGAIETHTGRDENGRPILYDEKANAIGFRERVPGSERPVPYVFRVMSEDEWQNAAKDGHIQSDQRMNLANEGTVTSFGSTGTFYMAPGLNRVVRIDVKPEDNWKVGNDGYVKTPDKIPFSRVSMVSPKIQYTKDGYSYSIEIIKGDVPGHEFHGNQWTGGGGTLGAWTPSSEKGNYVPGWDPVTLKEAQGVNAWESERQAIQNANLLKDIGPVLKNEVVTNISQKSGLSYDRTNSMVKSWAMHSSDGEPDSVALQMAAARFAGDTPGNYLQAKWDQLDKLGSGMADRTADADRFVRAMYDDTQKWLGDRGIKEMYLYRGAYFGGGYPAGPEPDSMRKAFYGEADVRIGTSPLSSWTLNSETAKRFASSGPEKSTMYLLTAQVPARYIMATPFTGIGAIHEMEVVVMGSRDHEIHAKNLDAFA